MAESKSPQSGGRGESWVQKIVKDPAKPPAVLLLSGYVAPAADPQDTRVYLSADLSAWVDVLASAILHQVDAPREESTLGGSTVWVDASAKVKYGGAAAGATGGAVADMPQARHTPVFFTQYPGCTFPPQCPYTYPPRHTCPIPWEAEAVAAEAAYFQHAPAGATHVAPCTHAPPCPRTPHRYGCPIPEAVVPALTPHLPTRYLCTVALVCTAHPICPIMTPRCYTPWAGCIVEGPGYVPPGTPQQGGPGYAAAEYLQGQVMQAAAAAPQQPAGAAPWGGNTPHCGTHLPWCHGTFYRCWITERCPPYQY